MTVRRKEWLLAGGIFGFALLVRLAYLLDICHTLPFRTPVLDSQNYDLLARKLAGGGGLTPEHFWQPIFYPLWLASLYSVPHSSIVIAKIAQALLGACTCLLTYLLGRRICDRRTGLLAAGIVALYGPVIFFEAELLANVWAAFWAVALILLLLKMRESPRPVTGLLLGICSGLSLATRPTFFPFVVLSWIWLAWGLRKSLGAWTPALKHSAWALAPLMAICIIIAGLTAAVTGRAALLPTSRGLNLYVGNNPHSIETEATRSWEFVHLRNQAQEHGFTGPWGEDEYFSRLVRQYVFSQPADFARSLIRKATIFICSREVPSYEDIYLYRRWSWLLRPLAWKAGSFGFPFGVLLPLALVGLIWRFRTWPAPLLLFPLLDFLSITLAHVFSRTRTPSVPVLAILAAAGVLALFQAARAAQWRQLAGACAVIAVAFVLQTRPGPFRLERINTEAELEMSAGYYNQTLLYDLGAARRHYERALQLEPDCAGAHFDLATVLADTGQPDAALAHYREAIRLAPDYTEFRYNLANLLLRQKKPDEAIAEYERVLQLSPRNAQAHYNLGYVLTDKNRLDEAGAHYRAALMIDPTMLPAAVNWAVLLENQGRVDDAITVYRKAAAANPGNPDLRRRLNGLLARNGRPLK